MNREERIQAAEKRRECRERYKEERASERARLEREYGMTPYPKEARDALWDKAWEDGHAHGYHEVEIMYDDLMDVVRPFLKGFANERQWREEVVAKLDKIQKRCIDLLLECAERPKGENCDVMMQVMDELLDIIAYKGA